MFSKNKGIFNYSVNAFFKIIFWWNKYMLKFDILQHLKLIQTYKVFENILPVKIL